MADLHTLTHQPPYAIFDYQDGEGRDCWMVSTLSLPQHPVALCGPSRANAEHIHALLSSEPEPYWQVFRRDLSRVLTIGALMIAIVVGTVALLDTVFPAVHSPRVVHGAIGAEG